MTDYRAVADIGRLQSKVRDLERTNDDLQRRLWELERTVSALQLKAGDSTEEVAKLWEVWATHELRPHP